MTLCLSPFSSTPSMTSLVSSTRTWVASVCLLKFENPPHPEQCRRVRISWCFHTTLQKWRQIRLWKSQAEEQGSISWILTLYNFTNPAYLRSSTVMLEGSTVLTDLIAVEFSVLSFVQLLPKGKGKIYLLSPTGWESLASQCDDAHSHKSHQFMRPQRDFLHQG